MQKKKETFCKGPYLLYTDIRKSELDVGFSRIWKQRKLGSARIEAVTLFGSLTVWYHQYLELNCNKGSESCHYCILD